MIWDRLRAVLRGHSSATEQPRVGAKGQRPPGSGDSDGVVLTRHSNGLDQFFQSLQDQPTLSLLDFAGASQSNITYITSLGHRLFSEDILSSLDAVFPDGNQGDMEKIQQFLDTSFSFRDYDFDGALLWDSLQYLSPPLLGMAVERLHRTLRPGAHLLAFFHADERAQMVPMHSYRIAGPSTLQLAPRGYRRPGQAFNNRAIERVFYKFQSVKFFLARDNLREVIVKR